MAATRYQDSCSQGGGTLIDHELAGATGDECLLG